MAILCKTVGKEICDILGLDGNKVRKIVLTFESNSLVMADAAILVEIEEFEKLKPVLKRYKMVPILDEVDVTPLGAESKVWAVPDYPELHGFNCTKHGIAASGRPGNPTVCPECKVTAVAE